MKALLLYTLACALGVQSVSIPQKGEDTKWQYSTKRQAKQARPVICNGPGGKVPDVLGAAPRRQELIANSTLSGSKRVKMRYGPYSVPNMMTKSIMNESGSLWNCGDDKIEKPCEECTIVRLKAGLEYPNGTNANIDSGMWLHHMVQFAVGPGRWDATCHQNKESLPHFGVGSDSRNAERIFASGNERTPADLLKFADTHQRTGLHIRREDSFRAIVDLMNMNMEDRIVYMTMTYDFVEGPLPVGWMDLKPIWFDADQCGMSEVHPPKTSGSFAISSEPWKPNFEGDIVGVGAHLHDGGANIEIMASNTTMACDSVAQYGESPEYIFKPAGEMAGDTKIAEKHISSMSTCYFDELGVKKLQKGQSWVLKGKYNYDKFPGNMEGGEQQDIMAIAIMFVAVPGGGVPEPPSS